MMKLLDILGIDMTWFSQLIGLGGTFTFLNIPTSTFWVALACSIVGAVLLSRQTADSGGFNYPINLAALFFGAVFANWLLADVPLPLDPDMQVPALFSVLGMSFTALTIMWIVRRG